MLINAFNFIFSNGLGLTNFDLTGLFASMPKLDDGKINLHNQKAANPLDISNLKATIACKNKIMYIYKVYFLIHYF